jgi:hypothetical protein
MRKLIMVIIILLSLVLIAGCIADPFIAAGKSVYSTGVSTAASLCQQDCQNGGKFLPPGCTCPTPTPTPVGNVNSSRV